MYIGKRYINAQSNYQTLSEEKIREIHSTSLRILEEIGMVVKHKGALKLLKDNGARVLEDRVYLSAGMVENALKTTPSRVTLYDRNGEPALFLEGRNTFYGPGSDTLNLIDYESRKRRPWTKKDIEDGSKICDALENIDFIMSMGFISDVKRTMVTREQYAAMTRNTTKPQVVVCDTGEDFGDVIRMAAAVRGGMEELSHKPYFVLYAEPTSPLVNVEEALDKLLMAAEHRIPTNYAQGGMAGATTPVTAAGTLALGNAEGLLGLVIHQLKNPGAPFVYGFGNSPIDMVSGQAAYSTPLAIQIQGGMCDLGRYYNLPIWGESGNGCSKIPDEQAVMEASQYILLAAQQGCNLCHDVGYLDFGLSYSFEHLVCCDEIINRTKETLDEVKVNEETLAFEEIKKIGPGGNYLKSKQTRQQMKTLWRGNLSDMKGYDDWRKDGSTSMSERAHEKVKKIIAEYIPPKLDEKIDREIEKILEEARKNC